MDKKIYEIIKAYWKYLKDHIQSIDKSDSTEWWDEEHDCAVRILDMTKNEPEYIKEFTKSLLNESWKMLHRMYKEKKGENHDTNRT